MSGSATDGGRPAARKGWLRCAPDGRLLAADEALARMLGFEASSALLEGVPKVQDLFGRGADRSRLRPPLEDSLPVEEARWVRKDGTSVWVRLTADAPAGPATGSKAEGALTVQVEDVTGRQHLENHLRQARRMESLGQLAGGMANDLNNFLAAIMAHVELLEEGLTVEERERVGHDLREIRRAATTSAQMVKHLLSFSRGERIRLQKVSLGDVVRDGVRLVRPLLPPEVDLETREEPVEPVLADPAAVEQMLLTLVTNARDAMPDGGTLTIQAGPGGFDRDHLAETGWGDPGDYGVVTVRDTGRGMSPAIVARLFQPFFETRPRGDAPGLSMAMVYGIMKQHRGFIEVESEPGRGTTVRLYFRLVTARVRPAPGEEEEGTEGRTILFVEDDDSLRRVTSRILRSRGYRVLEAANGIEALEVIAAEGRPDLLITDLIMPSMTGAELLEHLEAEGDPPRILMTSGFRPEFLMGWKDVEPSAYPFLEKPWQIDALLKAVRSVLDREAAGGG